MKKKPKLLVKSARPRLPSKWKNEKLLVRSVRLKLRLRWKSAVQSWKLTKLPVLRLLKLSKLRVQCSSVTLSKS